jgi:hypothetical protein
MLTADDDTLRVQKITMGRGHPAGR